MFHAITVNYQIAKKSDARKSRQLVMIGEARNMITKSSREIKTKKKKENLEPNSLQEDPADVVCHFPEPENQE